jgi:hemin uptake protein HemP
MNRAPTPPISHSQAVSLASPATAGGPLRLRSSDLFRQLREVEIEHEGRIYRLRLTQLNKLILTA